MVAGPTFEDHVALIQERQKLMEHHEAIQLEADSLEGLATWFTLHLEDAESNTQLAILFQEVEKKKKESMTLVRKREIYMYMTLYMC